MRVEDIAGRATISVEEASELWGVSRPLGYEAARRYLATGGREGLPVLRVGAKRLRVPVGAFLALLGFDQSEASSAVKTEEAV